MNPRQSTGAFNALCGSIRAVLMLAAGADLQGHQDWKHITVDIVAVALALLWSLLTHRHAAVKAVKAEAQGYTDGLADGQAHEQNVVGLNRYREMAENYPAQKQLYAGPESSKLFGERT